MLSLQALFPNQNESGLACISRKTPDEKFLKKKNVANVLFPCDSNTVFQNQHKLFFSVLLLKHSTFLLYAAIFFDGGTHCMTVNSCWNWILGHNWRLHVHTALEHKQLFKIYLSRSTSKKNTSDFFSTQCYYCYLYSSLTSKFLFFGLQLHLSQYTCFHNSQAKALSVYFARDHYSYIIFLSFYCITNEHTHHHCVKSAVMNLSMFLLWE